MCNSLVYTDIIGYTCSYQNSMTRFVGIIVLTMHAHTNTERKRNKTN